VYVRVIYHFDVVGQNVLGPFFQARKISNLLQTQVQCLGNLSSLMLMNFIDIFRLFLVFLLEVRSSILF